MMRQAQPHAQLFFDKIQDPKILQKVLKRVLKSNDKSEKEVLVDQLFKITELLLRHGIIEPRVHSQS